MLPLPKQQFGTIRNYPVGDINFWKRRGTDEYGGAVASPKQFSLELSQMVSLSARRIKLAEVEK